MLLLTDRQDHSRYLARDLSLIGPCKAVPLGSPLVDGIDCRVVITDVSLSDPKTIAQLRQALDQLRPKSVPLLCLISRRTHLLQSQAFALGATEFLSIDTPRVNLLSKVSQLLDISQSSKHACDGAATAVTQRAVLRTGIILADMLESAEAGRPISRSRINKGSEIVLDALEKEGLRAWLDVVWRHDDRTYQHCLLVAGLAAAFSVKLGFGVADRRLLTEAALLHDIGKSRIPLAVLNKTGKLTDDEMRLMRTHASVGYDMLASQGGFDSQLLDVVRHHHEYLDASGYPDGLAAERISDLVRLTTICDIYAALLERRAYKEPIAPDVAFDILVNMQGKLDQDLVQAFRPVTKSMGHRETLARKSMPAAPADFARAQPS